MNKKILFPIMGLSIAIVFSIFGFLFLTPLGDDASRDIVISSKDVPKFEIHGLDRQYAPDEPIMISVQKIGYDMCDSWDAKIIDQSDNSIVWEDWNVTSCGQVSPPRIDTFTYIISNDVRTITVPKAGSYLFQIDMGDVILEKEFTVIEQK